MKWSKPECASIFYHLPVATQIPPSKIGAIVSYTPSIDKNGPLEYLSAKQKAPTDKASSGDDVRDKRNCNSHSIVSVSQSSSKSKCIAFLSLQAQSCNATLRDESTGHGAVPNHVKSSFIPPNRRSHGKLVKSSTMRPATSQSAPVQGPIALHVIMVDLHACA